MIFVVVVVLFCFCFVFCFVCLLWVGDFVDFVVVVVVAWFVCFLTMKMTNYV